ncbi:MAG: sensor histidine kinase [Paracoccus sp. (in: a-proteobacteria)]|uniref:sensor histidine kinase n=1 Tax=Paracoccus sp. TaxID=267 RepID=UPI0039194099
MSLDLDDLYRLLRTSHLQTQGVIDTIRDPLLVLDNELTIISANPAFYRMFETSRDDTVGVAFHELGDGQWNIDELRLILEKVIPNSASVFDYEVTAKFPAIGQRTMLLSAQRIAQPGSGRRILLLSMVDATLRQQKEESQSNLIGELHHRLKNLLSVTRALARQTNVKDRTAAEYRDAFLGRLDALGKVLEVTAKEDMAELPALAETVLAPYMGKRNAVVLEKGPKVSLSAHESMALGMILHELATNAAKYGALSAPDGRVTIVWTISDEEIGQPHVNLRWRESNGPEVTSPTSTGFGTRLIQFTAESDLGGRVEQIYEPDGLVVTLSFPLGPV